MNNANGSSFIVDSPRLKSSEPRGSIAARLANNLIGIVVELLDDERRAIGGVSFWERLVAKLTDDVQRAVAAIPVKALVAANHPHAVWFAEGLLPTFAERN